MAPHPLLDDPLEIGKRIGAACGYTQKKRSEIAVELGRDERTLRSYVLGNLGDYNTPELRETLIRKVERITDCPPEIFGLSAPEPTEVDRLSQVVAEQGLAQNGLSAELAEAQKTQRGMLTRIERLERGEEGAR